MTAQATLGDGLRHLQSLGLPRLEAQMLVLHACDRSTQDRAWLISHDDQPLTQDQQHRLRQDAQRRLQGEPMAYIVGHKDFHALRLKVDARVLDPRDDTETLVDWALELPCAEVGLDVLDLGTGSGAIALALAHARPAWRVTGSDASAPALEVARANGQSLHLNVRWVQGSWLNPFAGERFDLIVSNPPYIRQGDPHLSALGHEPPSALSSGADGLDDIKKIVTGSGDHLNPGGWLLLEHGHDQAEAVRQLLQSAGFQAVATRRDLAGIERCTGGLWRPMQDLASREII